MSDSPAGDFTGEVDDRTKRFRTITSLISVLKRLYHIDDVESRSVPTAWRPSFRETRQALRHKRKLGMDLQLLNALATILVRSGEVVAVATTKFQTTQHGKLALGILAHTGHANDDSEDYVTVQNQEYRLIRPVKIRALDLPLLYQQLFSQWDSHNFEGHVATLTYFINRCGELGRGAGPVRDENNALFMRYVVCRSAPKFRIRMRKGQKFLLNVLAVQPESLQWNDPSYVENSYDKRFHALIRNGIFSKRIMAHIHAFRKLPQHQKAPGPSKKDGKKVTVADLIALEKKRIFNGIIRDNGPETADDLFPNLMAYTATPHNPSYYTSATYREFHLLLCLLLLGYMKSVAALLNERPPTIEKMGESINTACIYSRTLYVIAHSSVIEAHFLMVAMAVRKKSSDNVAIEEPTDAEVSGDNPGADHESSDNRAVGDDAQVSEAANLGPGLEVEMEVDTEVRVTESTEAELTASDAEDVAAFLREVDIDDIDADLDSDEEDMAAGMEAADGVPKYCSTEKYTCWLRLQTVHIHSFNTIVAWAEESLGKVVNISVLSVPYTGKEMTPWRDLVKDIIEGDKGDELCRRIEKLLPRLKPRDAKKLQAFEGRVHCEAVLAAIMFCLSELLSKSAARLKFQRRP